MMRLIAVIVLFTPGVLAAYGIKLMRDTLFADYHPFFINTTIQFIVGLILFIGGIAFLGGFIFHRDKKRNLVRKKEKNDSKPL